LKLQPSVMSVTSYRAAAEIIAHDPVAAWTYRVREASALVDHGREFGESTRERAPLQWAMTQNNLGTVLAPLGERESGTTRLEEAVTAYREALQERTRERVPLQWAAIQRHLGNALRRLGERESDTAQLEGAVTAFREALQERTRERVPLDWATTQNNLGNALRILAERESGTARPAKAVTAFDSCLIVTETVWPAERVQEIRSNRDEAGAEARRRAMK